jgi:hypothetical protein
MPQARSGGSRSDAGKTAGRGRSAASTSGSSSGRRASSASRGTRSGAGRAGASSGSPGAEQPTQNRASGGSADPRIEAAAERLRKLNERIIAAGKDAGETTLTAYEKALKAIATTLERGPGSSEVEWVSNLATTQAKFIREMTNAWTSAAREMLK